MGIMLRNRIIVPGCVKWNLHKNKQQDKSRIINVALQQEEKILCKHVFKDCEKYILLNQMKGSVRSCRNL